MLSPIEKNFYDLVRDGYRAIDEVPMRIREKVMGELIKDGYLSN